MIGRIWNAKEREQQAYRADDARHRGAGVPELDGQAQAPEAEKEHGDLRMRDGAEQPLPPRHLDGPNLGVRRPDHLDAAVPAAHLAAVELLEQVVEVRRDQVDERRVGVQGLAFGERQTLGDCLLGQLHVALPLARDRPRVGRDVGGRLLRRGLVHLGAGAGDRMRGADVRAGRHRRHVRRDGYEEPGRRGAGAARTDVDHHRGVRLDDPRIDLARGVDQPARRPQHHDHQVRARAIRLVEGLGDVLGGHRMDERLDLRRVDDRTPGPLLLRSRPDRGQQHQRPEGGAPPEHEPNPTTGVPDRHVGLWVCSTPTVAEPLDSVNACRAPAGVSVRAADLVRFDWRCRRRPSSPAAGRVGSAANPSCCFPLATGASSTAC